MNKDVIYIEPEDDITDILTKIKGAKGEIVALVPPKKAGVLRSAVNFKLIAKTARETDKTAVLVTTDGSLVKLAGAVGMAVAKNLQTKPEVPGGIAVKDNTVETEEEDVIDGEEAKAIVAEERRVEKEAAKKDSKKKPTEKEAVTAIAAEKPVEDDVVEEEEIIEEAEAKSKKKKKGSVVPDFAKYRKIIILGVIGAIAIAGFLVWALIFAPTARISVTVRTTAKNFSENVSFVTDKDKADPENGVFLMEEQKLVKSSRVEFVATGEVDKGSKATGTLTLKRNATTPRTAIELPAGSRFTINSLTFITTEKATLRAIADDDCTGGPITGCTGLKTDITATVKVAAEFAGASYNIEAGSTGWGPTGKGYSITGSAMTGGTTRVVKVVSETDIAEAKKSLDGVSEGEGRAELLADFPTGLVPIATSFVTKIGEPTSTPALDAEVADGVTPVLVAETTFTMFGVDRERIAEYIEAKSLEKFSGTELQKVYSTGVSDNADENKAFIESFREADGEFVGRLKSTVQIGPEVTEEMVAERTLGKKVGEVQTQLRSINGISSVNVQTSFFWVNSVPNDINKVTIKITVE